jgi:hypothetical protein
MIRAQDAVLAGTDPLAAPLCPSIEWNMGSPILDPAKVAGKIVICERGINDRVDKSKAVKEAGGDQVGADDQRRRYAVRRLEG